MLARNAPVSAWKTEWNSEFATCFGTCYSEFANAFADTTAKCTLLPFSFRKGSPMKLSISYSLKEWRETIEKETEKHVAKLEKLLNRYEPDLVMLQGSIEKHARKEEYSFSLNLSLPTGTLHAIGDGADVRASVKTAFAEIEAQIKKHMALLRKDYEWKRKRPRARVLA
jgi:ribosome-associated translation inhibitor RaiA